jgi:biotin carboxylase
MRILAVGTNRPCHQRLVAAGHDVTLAIEPTKVLSADGEAYAGVLHLDPGSVATGTLDDDLLRVITSMGLDAVAAYHDAYYEMAASMAAALALPCAVRLPVSRVVRDKALTRARTQHLACGRVRHVVLEPTTDPVPAASWVGYPCVVKPLDGEASMGVSVVGDPAGLVAATRRARGADGAGRCLVEERVPGPEFSVESFSIAGRHHVLAVTEKFTIPTSPVEQGHLVPARLDPGTVMVLEKATCDVLDAVGLTEGPSHTELILGPDGPRLVESHDRMGGDRLGVLVELATGVDYTDVVARHGASIPVPTEAVTPNRAQHAAVWFSDAAPAAPAVVRDVTGVAAAESVPGVVRVEVLKRVGSAVAPIAGSFDRPALAIAAGSDPDGTLDAARAAVAQLVFTHD